jgi:glucokinase
VTRRAIGIDVGGTKIAAGVVDLETVEVLQSELIPTAPERGGGAVLADCVALAARMGAPGLPVGIGICEMVGRDGRITSAETIEWRGLDVEAVGHGGSVVVESDVRAAALAEARFGAGVGLESFLYVIVGTGASVCLVLDGAPLLGARGNAIVLGSPPAELVASGGALSKRAGVDARQVLDDPAYEGLVQEAVAVLGGSLATLVNGLDPDMVVIGGGLGRAEPFFGRVVSATRAGIEYADTRALPIVPSALGPDGGVVGAALAGARRYGEPDVDRDRPVG